VLDLGDVTLPPMWSSVKRQPGCLYGVSDAQFCVGDRGAGREPRLRDEKGVDAASLQRRSRALT
jgi:hypothetical protein